MGDRPVNLNSPEQLAWVVYGRKPDDKKVWPTLFEGRMVDAKFKSTVTKHSTSYTNRRQSNASTCYGSGQIRKVKKDGTPFARPNRCVGCDGCGYTFVDTNQLAGLQFTAPTAKFISANGFSTGKGQPDIP